VSGPAGSGPAGNGPTRVLLTLDLPPKQDGGIATLVDVLATGMAQLKQPTVVYARGTGTDVAAWDRSRPYPVRRMWGHSWIHHTSRNLVPYIFEIYSKYRPAVLYAAAWQLAGLPARIARRLGMPVVVLVYGRDVTARPALPRPVVEADRVIALTHWMADELADRGLARASVALPGVLPAYPGPLPPEEPLFAPKGSGPLLLSVGRLVPRKGHDRLLEAFVRVRASVPQARLLIVGDGPQRGALAAQIGALGLTDHVTLAGFLPPPQLEQAYRAADLFVLACREEAGGDTEGFGLVFLEAAARGLPVIGGDTGGVGEAVVHEETGLLVDSTDHRAIAAAIEALLRDPTRAAAMGLAGRQRVEQSFRPAAYAARVLEAGP
jgi:phosphatidyl-myo-inositol dimannoside synthase